MNKIRKGDRCYDCGRDLIFVTISYSDEKILLKLWCENEKCFFYRVEKVVARDLKKERITDDAQDMPRPEADRSFQKDLRRKEETETPEAQAV